MSNTRTIHVPHLGGISAAYQMPKPYDSTKPTLLMINAFTMSSELYRAQFDDPHLTASMNLLAVELLGHGQTRTDRNHWTYWDTAEMNLQVLDALGIEKAFILGTSQGGWVTVQMALMRPEKVPDQVHAVSAYNYSN
jgi:pimeloyl-ACP methyl ester carboxylesterase